MKMSAASNICTTMIANAFHSVHFPILPVIRKNEAKELEIIERNVNLFTPCDFDFSPFFDVIKYAKDLFGYARGLYSQVHFWRSEENKGTSLQALIDVFESSEEMMVTAETSIASNVGLPMNQGISDIALTYEPVLLDGLSSTLLTEYPSVAPIVAVVPTPLVDAFKDLFSIDTRSEIMRVGGNIYLFQEDNSNWP